MTRLLLTLIVFCAFITQAQELEIQGSFYTGGFYFQNNFLKEDVTLINLYNYSYTDIPYSQRLGLLYGLSLNLIKTNPSKLRYGMEIGIETMKNRVDFQKVLNVKSDLSSDINQTGKTKLKLGFVNFFPKIGYQISKKSFRINVDGGIEVGVISKVIEKGNISEITDRSPFTTNRKTRSFDFRPRLQIEFKKNKLGAYIAYSSGISNYIYIGAENKTFSKLFRLGVTYGLYKISLKKKD